jgi:type IV pilus assembly protein PilN
MIRINLLPQKREGKRASAEGSQMWLGVLLGVLVLEVILLLFIYNAKRDQLASVNKKNQELQGQIDQIKTQISNHPQIKAELKELRDREEAIQKLQSARSGPTSTLLELSRVLTSGRGPTVDRDKIEQLKRDNPTSVPNPNWDPRRLWMTNYSELDRVVRIAGLARDGEDVSEFLRRLSLSDFFYEVRLLPAAKVVDGQTRLELVRFEISAKVRY